MHCISTIRIIKKRDNIKGAQLSKAMFSNVFAMKTNKKGGGGLCRKAAGGE